MSPTSRPLSRRSTSVLPYRSVPWRLTATLPRFRSSLRRVAAFFPRSISFVPPQTWLCVSGASMLAILMTSVPIRMVSPSTIQSRSDPDRQELKDRGTSDGVCRSAAGGDGGRRGATRGSKSGVNRTHNTTAAPIRKAIDDPRDRAPDFSTQAGTGAFAPRLRCFGEDRPFSKFHRLQDSLGALPDGYREGRD